ncbi:hypothetical protein E2K93_10890 [Thalassotalea sp. HSM 43]|uniref:hypothetical protein n=1 Tax=Thalassotalea sp. HSM 43 TaxID=2552945 RepID=UPI001081FC1F|nr:hypothetical protein [Thalassotalea sp. HSM 43]QBY04855.1 hypothetical protein E2K93_10890 [Thalassotalea sp. HSM 43]
MTASRAKKSKLNLVNALSLSVLLHLVLLAVFLSQSVGVDKLSNRQQWQENANLIDTPKQNIKSYIYRSPKKTAVKTQLAPELRPELTSEQAPELEPQLAPQLKAESNDHAEVEDNNDDIANNKATEPTSKQQSPSASPASSSKDVMAKDTQGNDFNPYKTRMQFAEKLQQQSLLDMQKPENDNGPLPNWQAAPIKPLVKTQLQIDAENTTVIGNETIIKKDGWCQQSTDLSFIDDNLGTVYSASFCGESKADKYYREFMNKHMEAYKRKGE